MGEPPSRVRNAYDAIADAYDRELRDELAGKPLDRALLAAFVELAGPGPIADVGCGPGHVTRYLAERRADVVGVDLSPAMVAIASARAPDLTFRAATMLALPAADASWAGVVALYSIIHLTAAERTAAFREFARVVRPGGAVLVAFHVDDADHAAGDAKHLTEWFGEDVDVDTYFLDPGAVQDDLRAAGFEPVARLDRRPAGPEYPSRRCYLLASRR